MRDPAVQRLLDKARRGEVVTPADTVATIGTLEELDHYRRVLGQRGALTAEAMAAIRDRQDVLRAREGRRV